MSATDIHNLTPCQISGHRFVDGFCPDCGESEPTAASTKQCDGYRNGKPCERPADWECIKESAHKTKSTRRLAITKWCDRCATELKAFDDQNVEWNRLTEEPKTEPIPHFNENDCGGVFDGHGVISDADPGL